MPRLRCGPDRPKAPTPTVRPRSTAGNRSHVGRARCVPAPAGAGPRTPRVEPHECSGQPRSARPSTRRPRHRTRCPLTGVRGRHSPPGCLRERTPRDGRITRRVCSVCGRRRSGSRGGHDSHVAKPSVNPLLGGFNPSGAAPRRRHPDERVTHRSRQRRSTPVPVWSATAAPCLRRLRVRRRILQ